MGLKPMIKFMIFVLLMQCCTVLFEQSNSACIMFNERFMCPMIRSLCSIRAVAHGITRVEDLSLLKTG